MPKRGLAYQLYNPGSRLTLKSFKLYIWFAVFICGSIFTAYLGLHPPAIHGLPHTQDSRFRSLEAVLKDTSPEAPEFQKLVSSARIQPGEGWLQLRDGRTFSVGGTEAPLISKIPPSCWNGTRAFLMEPDTFVQFFPHSKGDQVWAVSVFRVPSPSRPEEFQTPFGQFANLPGVFLVGLSVAAGALVVTLLLIGKLDRPLTSLRRSINLLGPDTLDYRIQDYDGLFPEFEQAFNEMAARLAEVQKRLVAESDRAVKAEQSRRIFLSRVSVALRDPLGSIRSELVTHPNPARLEALSQGVHRIAVKVKQLLDLSRWERSHPPAHFVDYPVVESLMRAVTKLAPEAEQRNCSLKIEGFSGLMVTADRAWVDELFFTLLEDPILHHAGSISITAEPGDARVRFIVQDDRPGESSSGERLGLAIASKLVEVHGGRFEVCDLKGARVEFDLPRSVE